MTWSDYVKVKKIGEGAFGSAWLVKNKKDNKDYVVKKINVAKMPTKEREEAKKEVSVLAQMNHPNIVSYIDSFEEDGNLCIVMDYCDGGDLYTKIQSMRGNPINEDQILDWFVQIALALKHVHDRKILHRDLKSQNIFLTKSGVIKLGDFGVAKVLNNTSEFARTAIGTPYYMSPEICNHMSYNNKSDVWSLGCILFEMTNMKHPFEANNLKMLICKIIRGTYDQVNPRYSYEMRNLVASMLKKNPRERPSVNGILRKPFIMRRCARFLTNEEMQDEFSHTVLHGENFRRKLHVQNNAAAKPSAKPLNVPVVNVLANPHPRPIYDPSKIYGQPLYKRPSSAVQKSQEKKSIDIKRRPPSVERPIIKGSYLEQRQEKKEYDEALLRKKQKELIEKQKVERIKRERELGWQNILPSNDKEQDHNKEKHPFVNYNRGADHYKMYEQQLNEHAKRRQELEEAHDRLADQLKNRVPLVDHKEKIEPKKRANVSKVKKSSEEFKKIKEEYEKNRANGKRIFNNPITPRPQIVKKSNDQQLKEKLDKIRGNKSYLNRKPAVVIKSKQNQIFSNEKPRFGAPLKRPSPLRKGELFKKPSNSILKPTKVYQEKKAIISPKDIKQETEFGITELLDNIGIKGKQISKEEVLKDPNELLFEKPVENRRCWSEKTDLTPLNDFPLIENTVMPSPTIKIVSPRKEWDQPHLSVLNALDQANILTSKTVMFDKTLKEGSNKSSITKGDTYLIGDQVDSKNVKYGPTDSQLINEKPPDFINNLTSNSFKATWEEALSKISPLKSDKLQMTKNMWLEMTLGKFDTKNIQLLRTCSVPDLLSKAINEDSDDDNEVVITKGKIGTLKETAKKAQSLYDLNFENSERSSESDLSEKISYSDSSDLTQVRETMESFLFDSDEENDRKNKNIKPDDKETYDESDDLTEVIQSMQCYLSDEDDLTADKAEKNANDSRKRSDIPLDSLEISKKNLNELNDDNDCEIVSLNGESDGSDTEFEDDKPVFVNCSIEERRAILEKNLGQDELKKNFRCLKALIQEEQSNDLEPNTNRESFKKFVQLFPDKEFFWYYELCELISNI